MIVVINVERERELLSTANKKVWDDIVQEEILAYAREKDLTIAQVEVLTARKMIEMRYRDLQGQNVQHEKSNDELAKRAIRRNKLTMKELEREFKALAKGNDIGTIEPELSARIDKIILKRNKSKKAGK